MWAVVLSAPVYEGAGSVGGCLVGCLVEDDWMLPLLLGQLTAPRASASRGQSGRAPRRRIGLTGTSRGTARNGGIRQRCLRRVADSASRTPSRGQGPATGIPPSDGQRKRRPDLRVSTRARLSDPVGRHSNSEETRERRLAGRSQRCAYAGRHQGVSGLLCIVMRPPACASRSARRSRLSPPAMPG
jgi:hypothetical protein